MLSLIMGLCQSLFNYLVHLAMMSMNKYLPNLDLISWLFNGVLTSCEHFVFVCCLGFRKCGWRLSKIQGSCTQSWCSNGLCWHNSQILRNYLDDKECNLDSIQFLWWQTLGSIWVCIFLMIIVLLFYFVSEYHLGIFLDISFFFHVMFCVSFFCCTCKTCSANTKVPHPFKWRGSFYICMLGFLPSLLQNVGAIQ
jgi:hypothetical protein